MLPHGSLIEQLSERLSRYEGVPIDIEVAVPLGGGSINEAYRLETNAGGFFVKVNVADHHPSFFEAEADGLQRLRSTRTLRVPEVICWGEDHDESYLLMEFIESGTRSDASAERLGRGLAALHRHTGPAFGLDRDNYIGTLAQQNTPSSGWAGFFIAHRLEPLVEMAHEKNRLGSGVVLRFERLYARLGELFPEEPPAVLHGDLWNGNVLYDLDGAPVLLDPAVYYGHREMDLAMTRLFGGFDPGFMASYQDSYPLEQGWEERQDLCNLYPLLVHVNLFGGGYAQQVDAILRRFV